MKVLLRSEKKAEFDGAGITGPAQEFLLKLTAKERHESRIAAAIYAAEEYYLGQAAVPRTAIGKDVLAAAAGAILRAEMIGSGSKNPHETVRHPAFAGCGKGRSQAADGPAWTAAIADAAQQRLGKFSVMYTEEVPQLVFYHNDFVVVDEWMPLLYQWQIVQRGLEWSYRFPTGVGHAWYDNDNYLEQWAELFNRLSPLAEAEIEKIRNSK